MIHVRNLVKSRGDSKNASSGLASASVSLSSGQRILVLDPKDGEYAKDISFDDTCNTIQTVMALTRRYAAIVTMRHRVS